MIGTTQYYQLPQPLVLENGSSLFDVQIAYHSYGQLNSTKNNCIWICHALTANSDVADWWPGMVGPGLVFDTNKYFVVCANILGSCYGTNAKGFFPENEMPTLVTIRDEVQAHIALRQHLGIEKIDFLVGGSMGGYQAMEWAIMEPQKINKLALMVTSATESAWGIGIHTAQRLAIETDPTWLQQNGGANGLRAARAFGMISYRTYDQFLKTQSDTDTEKVDAFKASGYIIHQGNKLVQRFTAKNYWLLTKSMDSHNIARGRNATVAEVLKTIQQPTLILGISTDFLCPVQNQQFLANNIPNSKLFIIDSEFGHDGFLTETEQVGNICKGWM